MNSTGVIHHLHLDFLRRLLMLRLSVPLDIVSAVALVGASRRHAEVHLPRLAVGALRVAHPPDADVVLHLFVRTAVRRVANPGQRHSRRLSPLASAAGVAGIEAQDAVDAETHAAAAAAAVVIIVAVPARSGPKPRCGRRRGGIPRRLRRVSPGAGIWPGWRRGFRSRSYVFLEMGSRRSKICLTVDCLRRMEVGVKCAALGRRADMQGVGGRRWHWKRGVDHQRRSGIRRRWQSGS